VIAAYLADAARDNYGVQKVERLAGNVGYLLLTSIDEAEYTGPTIAAAMAVLANTSALLIDLRRNNGGAPSGVAFLCSYFFPPEPVHVNDIYSREGDASQQFWTLPHLPGERYLDKPVYVLTSSRTFSGAEELAYDLQQLRRAKVVGETTAGAANPVDVYQLDPHFELRVPTGRAINPTTGTNWEGTGVTPDIAVDAEQALDVAHAAALHAILAGLGDEPSGAEAALADEAKAALAEVGG
jgi:C-terminal processing protease CtpA/Prc